MLSKKNKFTGILLRGSVFRLLAYGLFVYSEQVATFNKYHFVLPCCQRKRHIFERPKEQCS